MGKTNAENLPKIELSEEERKRLKLANEFNARKNGTRPGQIGQMLQPNQPKKKLVV